MMSSSTQNPSQARSASPLEASQTEHTTSEADASTNSDTTPDSDTSDSKAVTAMLKKQKHRKSLLELVKQATIGYADGSTVPFALISGMAALGNREAVISARLLEIVAGSLSMAGGAWLAASVDRSQFMAEEEQQRLAIETNPVAEGEEVVVLMQGYGIRRYATMPLIMELLATPTHFLRFMMDLKH
jgi:hypothetical protein